jgi:hypothetical protein
VAINYYLVVVSVAIAVTIFFDDSCISIPMVVPVANNCAVVIPVAVSVMAFANGYASADRPDPNANIVSQCRGSEGGDRSNYQSIPHSFLLRLLP